MLQNLYTQASDAHQTLLVEIETLKRDNDSLCEQVTTGIKQAHVFWTTQVHKLQTEQYNQTADRSSSMDRRRYKKEGGPFTKAKEEAEDWMSKFMDLGRVNTRLRLEVKK
jgi:hypothetical protein